MKRQLVSNNILSAIVVVSILMVSVQSFAQGPRPIVDENGNEIGLFERVVSRPGTVVTSKPGGGVTVEEPTPFTSYYVYEEQKLSGSRFISVGPNATQPPTGWVDIEQVIEWPNNLTLAFNEPVNRHPVLFFEVPASIGWMLSDPSLANSRSQDLVDKARTRDVDTLDGISAMEPDDFVHWSDRFYIMPVLDFVEREVSGGNGTSTSREPILVKTAAIPVNDTKGTANLSCDPEPALGVVFVVDTTLSMQPYIDRTRKMMEELTTKIQNSKVVDHLNFGLVGYRDKPALNQDVKYRWNTFQNLDPNSDPNLFVSQLKQLSAADQSTKGFNEDGLIGVLAAAEMDWDPYQMRWIILITDAGVHDPTVDDSGTTWNLRAVANRLWNEKNVGLMALHLATPDAKAKGNDVGAQRQLEDLSRWATTTSAYVRIEDGDINSFGTVIDTRIDEVIKQLQLTTAQLQQQAALGNAVAEIGLAQKLIWLGACNGTQPPDTVEGWIVDKALGTPTTHSGNRYAFEPRVLLTRVQLNELAKTLTSIVETAKSTFDSPENFFGELALTLGVASSDPNLINSGVVQGRLAEPVGSINKIGDVLPGYLSRLPYRSDFLTLDRRAWASMTPQQIRPWIHRVEAAIDTLRVHYNKTEKELFKLHPAASPGEWVFPVLLSDLP